MTRYSQTYKLTFMREVFSDQTQCNGMCSAEFVTGCRHTNERKVTAYLKNSDDDTANIQNSTYSWTV